MDMRASLTAEGIAIMRALEAEKPATERLFHDPYARHFVRPWLLRLTRLIVRSGYAEHRGPGVQGFLRARTRHIDDYWASCLEAGVPQMVVLGAGYDARAYRFADCLHNRVHIFEVDHPATQPVKIARVKQIFGALPQYVSYVAVDFDRESLAERLAAAGYVERLQTAFVWEGVTMYLTPKAVDATLEFIVRHSGPRSSVIFDFLDSAVIEGRVKRGEAAGMRRYRRFTGEGLTFGIAPGTVQAFLQQRGFCDVREATAPELERLYFSTGSNRGTAVAPVYAIANARTVA